MTNGQSNEEEIPLDDIKEDDEEPKDRIKKEPKYYECDDDYNCFGLD